MMFQLLYICIHAAVLVEKILRVQPDANKLCLLVRGTGRHLLLVVVKQVHHIMHDVLLHSFCACNAMQVIGTELFGLLREKHGAGFQQLIQDKVFALPGDIIYENLGLEAPMLKDLAQEIDIIVNIAATTNFYGRFGS